MVHLAGLLWRACLASDVQEKINWLEDNLGLIIDDVLSPDFSACCLLTGCGLSP